MTEGQKKAVSYAGKMLSLRMMTRKQLLDKLREKGYGEEDSAFAADVMENMRAIDDLEYARRFVQSKAASGYGEMRIRQELRHRGVDPELIDEALEEMPDSGGTIESFIRSKMKSSHLDKSEARKIADALCRKGFLWDDISAVLQKYSEEH